MTDEQHEPWLDPDFDDPTPMGDDGWPDPPRQPREPDPELLEMEELVAAPEALRTPQNVSGVQGSLKPLIDALRGVSVLPVAISALTAAIVWALMTPSLHQLPIWLASLVAGAGVWWLWRTHDWLRALVAAGIIVGTAGAFYFFSAAPMMVAIIVTVLLFNEWD